MVELVSTVEPPRRLRTSTRLLLAIVALIAVAATGGLAYKAGGSSSVAIDPVTGPVSPTQGRIVFQDDFNGLLRGWPTTPLPSGTTFGYEGGTYVIDAKGDLHHFVYVPYRVPTAELSAEVSATQDLDAPARAGFGVLCVLPANDLRFEFLLLARAGWRIEEATGVPGEAGDLPPRVLAGGDACEQPGVQQVTVEGVCDTQAGGAMTRLVMFVDGTKVADLVSSSPGASTGWLAGIDAASRSGAPSVVTARYFAERDTAPPPVSPTGRG